MGLFGGSSKRSTTSVSTQIDASDKRTIQENNGNIGGNVTLTATGDISGLTLEQTDFGAVEGALTLGERAIESFADVTSKVTDFGNSVLDRQSVTNQNNLNALKEFATEVKSDGQAQISKAFQNILLAVTVVGGIAVIARFKK